MFDKTVVCPDHVEEKPQEMAVVAKCEEEEPIPSAPPLSTPSPKLYPLLPNDSAVLSPHMEVDTPTPVATPIASPFPSSRSDCNLQRVCDGGGSKFTFPLSWLWNKAFRYTY